MKRFSQFVLLFLPMLVLAGCGGSSGNSTSPSSQQGQVFVTGEDAPVSSVVGFNVTIKKITLNNSTDTVVALSTPTAVDFGRLMGLRSLLALNAVAKGTYTSATVTFENSSPAPHITYVDVSSNPPTVREMTGTLSQSTVTVQFPSNQPLVVTSNGMVGLHLDFDLRDSLAVDNSNQITGAINPVLRVQAVATTDATAQITDFTGSVVSVSTSANSFLMQGPYGFQEKVIVNSSTQYNRTNSLSTLTANAVVSVVGRVQADGSILASGVELISTDRAYISGIVLAVNPSTGPAQTLTLWVGGQVGASSAIQADTVATVDVSLVSNYDVCFFDNSISEEVFNSTSLVVGQRVFIGGTVTGGIFIPDFISLRRQGAAGNLVTSSVSISGSSNLGSFQMQNDALLTYSAGGPFTVLTTSATDFENVNGLTGLQASGSATLVSRGLVFKNVNTGKPFVVAGQVKVATVN